MSSEAEHAQLVKTLTDLKVECRGIVGVHTEKLAHEGAQAVIDAILAAGFDLVKK